MNENIVSEKEMDRAKKSVSKQAFAERTPHIWFCYISHHENGRTFGSVTKMPQEGKGQLVGVYIGQPEDAATFALTGYRRE